MKLLLFSDVHTDAAAADRLIAMASRVDMVIGAGDYALARQGLAPWCDRIRNIGRPLILVPGNAETDQELAEVWAGHSNVHVLHGSGCRVEGLEFFGLGGAVPVTPFGAWSFDLSEERAAEKLAACPAGAILITHSPPRGVLDAGSRGVSLGSVAVRQTIERCQPPLAVCGHIHACGGKTQWLGKTRVVNAGPRGWIQELSVPSRDQGRDPRWGSDP